MRVDGASTIVAALHPPASHRRRPIKIEKVDIRTDTAAAWPLNDKQACVRGNQPAEWSWKISQTIGAAPITFVQATPVIATDDGKISAHGKPHEVPS
jgi:hypothetical protein